jgi:hypothetical protein
MVREAGARGHCQRYFDYECTLMPSNLSWWFGCDQSVIDDIVTLIALPEQARMDFFNHLCLLNEQLDQIHPDLSYTNGVAKGLRPFEDFYKSMRDALNAVEKIRGMGDNKASMLRDLMEGFALTGGDPEGFPDAVARCAELAAGLVGRSICVPGAHDWRLVAVLRDMRTWPDSFGASMPRHHTSQGPIIALLHKLMPKVVPARVSPSTIKAIWNPRPRKARGAS